jgi:hypothetical protein
MKLQVTPYYIVRDHGRRRGFFVVHVDNRAGQRIDRGVGFQWPIGDAVVGFSTSVRFTGRSLVCREGENDDESDRHPNTRTAPLPARTRTWP